MGEGGAGVLDRLREPLGPGDSGFTMLFDDSPVPEEVEARAIPRIALVCLGSLSDDHPELAPGLDIAREYGVADLEGDGEWVVGDLSRLDSA